MHLIPSTQVAAMASAEPRKNDLEPGLPSSSSNDPLLIDDKGLQVLYQPALHSARPSADGLGPRGKMSSFRRLAMTLLLVVAFLTAAAYASVPVYKRARSAPTDAEVSSFQDLLNSVSDASLHDVLVNVYEKYRHGVFPEDRTAMQAVHEDNAAMATSLVELARRQNPNVTASVTVSASSTATVVVVPTTETNTVVQTSGTDTVVVVNTQTTVTPVTPVQPTTPVDTPVQTTAQVSATPPPPGSSSSVPVPIQSSVPVQSSVPAQSVNSSPPPGSSTPAPVSPSPSSQANPTSQANPSTSQGPAQSSANGGGGGGSTTSAKATAAPGSASATTLVKTSSGSLAATSPGSAGASSSAGAVTAMTSSSTQQILYTTTLPNGSQSTVTSFTVVPAGEQASTPGVPGSAVTGSPSLQNGAVDGTQPRGMGLAGSLVAALVFVVGIL